MRNQVNLQKSCAEERAGREEEDGGGDEDEDGNDGDDSGLIQNARLFPSPFHSHTQRR